MGPDGLALSGEVEDYVLTILPGNPPEVTPEQANREFSTNEDIPLSVLDQDGTDTPLSTADDGLLAGIVDPDGDPVKIVAADVGERVLMTPSGTTAGTLNLLADGTFSFVPVDDFNGAVEFQVRVTDDPVLADTALTSPQPINVTITVDPVNDAPFATVGQPQITREIVEDEVQVFTAAELIGDMYLPGPPNELDQFVDHSVGG